MPTELQLLTKRAADLRKMMKEEATKQTPTKANRRADVVHNAADRQLNAAIARERTLAARILEIQGLLATGNFRTIEQLATAMESCASSSVGAFPREATRKHPQRCQSRSKRPVARPQPSPSPTQLQRSSQGA